jgi:hypothetical protein
MQLRASSDVAPGDCRFPFLATFGPAAALAVTGVSLTHGGAYEAVAGCGRSLQSIHGVRNLDVQHAQRGAPVFSLKFPQKGETPYRSRRQSEGESKRVEFSIDGRSTPK